MKYYTDTEYGITYRYGLLRKCRHMVFDSVADFERYMLAVGKVPDVNYDWRHAEVGEWVVADDGCVLEILRNSKGFVRTIVGTYVSRLMDMDTDFTKRENRYVLGSNGTTNRFKNVSRRKELTRGETLFAIFLLTGRNDEEAYCLAFNYVGKYARRYARLLMRQERVRKYMNERSIEAAKKCGIDEEWVISAFRDVVTDENIKTRDKLIALKQLGLYIGMEDSDSDGGGEKLLNNFRGEAGEQKFLDRIERPAKISDSGGLPDDIAEYEDVPSVSQLE